MIGSRHGRGGKVGAAALSVVVLAAGAFSRDAVAGIDGKAVQEAARLNNTGTALMNQSLLDRAAERFAEAARLDPQLTSAKVNEGIALLYLQKFPEAQTALDIAAAHDAKDPHAWYSLGLLYRSENQPQQALEAFERVVALDPADADSDYFVASLETELNHLPEALAAYRKALALNPSHASAEFGLARALQRSGKAEEARAAFTQFQHITSAHLGAPLSHNYGEEGRYGRVEDAPAADPQVGPMLPVAFAEAWRSKPVGAGGGAATCLIDLGLSSHPSKDLIVVGSGTHAVQAWHSTVAGTFEAVDPQRSGIDVKGTGSACAVGDYDNDGLPDLAIAVDDRVLLFHNLGGGKFEEVTAAVGITSGDHPAGLLFVDFDHDGDLDLFVTGRAAGGGSPNVLWRNNGNKTFTNWTKEAGLGGSGTTTSAMLSDLNNDRAVDLLVTGSSAAPTFYANRREGPFGAAPLFGDTLPPTQAVAVADLNKDGWMDVALAHSGAPGVTVWRNKEGTGFERLPLSLAGVTGATRVVPIDFDNDGWIDLAMLVETAGGPQLRVLRNLGPAGFADVSAKLGLDKLHLAAPRALLAADVDGDGATDLVVTEADGSTTVLLNHGGSRNHSLSIALKGIADNKTGVGAKVEVFGNGLWQKWEATGAPEILAGLGPADKADLVRILWPTGVPQDELDIAAAKPKMITELDRRGSSCPTLFAWDGGKFGFVTDVIGAGVVGHWVSPTAHNIPDPDEWIKIDGKQLRERDGTFSLRFGEPMEEVNFVDQVRLVAIDHPAATAVFPNEGFLSEPPFATERTIVATRPRPLAAAWDDHGHDALPLLREQDAKYVKDFTNLPFAGFANEHRLTIDLGLWTPGNPLRLLLHGFVEYFSASSMYAAWQAGIKPVPPYVEAQLPDGTWRRIVEDMGFPAGLPRTVVVDLTGKLPAGATRIRITTNLQIYWDQAEVENSADAQADVRTTELTLSKAELVFRGYPQQLDGATPGDLTYNYGRISRTGPFVPHRGAYTRYGEVTPLLRRVDDEFVVFGTGEDMDLQFSAASLPPLPEGWTRDFFFYANGFVKDMDFYEASPFLVGALPFHGMSTYPYPAGEHYPDDPVHTGYQIEWNTRFESGAPRQSYEFHYPAQQP